MFPFFSSSSSSSSSCSKDPARDQVIASFLHNAAIRRAVDVEAVQDWLIQLNPITESIQTHLFVFVKHKGSPIWVTKHSWFALCGLIRYFWTASNLSWNLNRLEFDKLKLWMYYTHKQLRNQNHDYFSTQAHTKYKNTSCWLADWQKQKMSEYKWSSRELSHRARNIC